MQRLAEDLGLAGLVAENPTIVPYSTAARIAADADGLLVLGVDEPAYMASKLFSYASLRKPLMVSIGSQSQMNDYFLRYPDLGTLVHFDGEQILDGESQLLAFLNQMLAGERVPRAALLAEHSAEGMTRRIARFLDACIGDAHAADAAK